MTTPLIERALTVAVDVAKSDANWTTEESLAELAQLAATARAEVVGTLVQRLRAPHPVTYLGKGKLKELAALKDETSCNVVLFDDELSPTQQRNLERALSVKIIDRTALILDIFAQRARTHEGRLQVELAQHEYLLPRLAGQWTHLERLGGGIGTRGPGETQLETDRRLIRFKIQRLKSELEKVRRHRALYRRRRTLEGPPIVALVGYTNAGKSTLLNCLGNARVFTENKLFATLDPTTRRILLPNKQEVLLTDTVGFIQKLPPTLVAAFRATLEELQEADLLLHVLDIAHPNAPGQQATVEEILEQLDLLERPRILVLNKVDKLLDMRSQGRQSQEERPGFSSSDAVLWRGGVPISALSGLGVDQLLGEIATKLEQHMTALIVRIPYQEARLIEVFRRRGSVQQQRFEEDGVVIEGKIPAKLTKLFSRYLRATAPGVEIGRAKRVRKSAYTSIPF